MVNDSLITSYFSLNNPYQAYTLGIARSTQLTAISPNKKTPPHSGSVLCVCLVMRITYESLVQFHLDLGYLNHLHRQSHGG